MTDTVDQAATEPAVTATATSDGAPSDVLLGRRSDPSRQRGWRLAVKRAADIVGASVLLAILAPLLAAVALAVKLDSRGPALFHQTRVGRGERPFTVHKFRSMVAGADPGSKARKAEELGVELLSESEFEALVDP